MAGGTQEEGTGGVTQSASASGMHDSEIVPVRFGMRRDGGAAVGTLDDQGPRLIEFVMPTRTL